MDSHSYINDLKWLAGVATNLHSSMECRTWKVPVPVNVYLHPCCHEEVRSLPEIKALVLPDVLHYPNDLQRQHVLPQVVSWLDGDADVSTHRSPVVRSPVSGLSGAQVWTVLPWRWRWCFLPGGPGYGRTASEGRHWSWKMSTTVKPQKKKRCLRLTNQRIQSDPEKDQFWSRSYQNHFSWQSL